MSLILVVEPDSRHAAQLASMAQNHLHAELVMAESGDRAVAALADRVPDIVLTAPLLPYKDEVVLSDYLRALGAAGAHVQTLTIPILSPPAAPQRSVRSRFRRDRDQVAPDGCDPALFAEQVGQYLRRARQCRGTTERPAPPTITIEEPPPPEVLVAEVVPQYESDVDLTPFLADLSEPDRSDRSVRSRSCRSADGNVPNVNDSNESNESNESNGSNGSNDSNVPKVLEADLVIPPPTSFARARSRSDMLPAVTKPSVRPWEERPAGMQQVITVPASTGHEGQPTVNVAVAVSVQVAQTSPSPAPNRTSKKALKPVQDEWGFFDPDQCGFRALLARLDAIAATEDSE